MKPDARPQVKSESARDGSGKRGPATLKRPAYGTRSRPTEPIPAVIRRLLFRCVDVLFCQENGMKKINTNTLPDEAWASPKGKYRGSSRDVSIALGRKPQSMDLNERHPFDVEITRIAPGQTPYPYHSHSAQWEFYHVISGRGVVRHQAGTTPIEPGDAFIFQPGEPHQLINDGQEDLILYVVADNPIGESAHYPDSGKWLVRSPERRLLRSESIEYYDGEE
jgi:uncharacterized cupin superfamily protein